MSDPRNPGAPSRRDDDALWIARVDDAFRPEPLDESGRARFAARLRERMETRRPTPLARLAPAAMVLAPAATALALAAAVGWALRAPAPQVRAAAPEAPAPQARAAAPADAQLTAWEWEVLLGDTLDAGRDEDLPEDYAAIAAAFRIP
ncbi:MAG TPA: hypothetical protein VKB65_04570 [Myxococcota bacterium]|nr:hypothetical protein [Myxococcota bacterium]